MQDRPGWQSVRRGGWSGICLILLLGPACGADCDVDCEQADCSPNSYGLTRGKLPASPHWGSFFRKLVTGPKPHADCNRSHWYAKSLRGDWHGHQWDDYEWSGDAYQENWRFSTWHCQTKHAAIHERTRRHSLAMEQVWCGRSSKCRNGYIMDASGTPLWTSCHAQSPCGSPPVCGSMFGSGAPLYPPRAYAVNPAWQAVSQR